VIDIIGKIYTLEEEDKNVHVFGTKSLERVMGLYVDRAVKRWVVTVGGEANPDETGPWDFKLDDYFDTKSRAGSWFRISCGEYEFLKEQKRLGNQMWYSLFKQLPNDQFQFEGNFDAIDHFDLIEPSDYGDYRLSASRARRTI
jgi:hypothetical protein